MDSRINALPRISALNVYPIKSLAQVSLPEANVEAMGLQYDRRWMLVEADGTFISQRDDPMLVRFKISLTERGLEVSTVSMGTLLVPFESEGPSRSVRVWKDQFDASPKQRWTN